MCSLAVRACCPCVAPTGRASHAVRGVPSQTRSAASPPVLRVDASDEAQM